MTGFLQGRGSRLQQSRIREAMRSVNTAGVLLRALELRTIHRRRYQVCGLLALWHIDGNHLAHRLDSVEGVLLLFWEVFFSAGSVSF